MNRAPRHLLSFVCGVSSVVRPFDGFRTLLHGNGYRAQHTVGDTFYLVQTQPTLPFLRVAWSANIDTYWTHGRKSSSMTHGCFGGERNRQLSIRQDSG